MKNHFFTVPTSAKHKLSIPRLTLATKPSPSHALHLPTHPATFPKQPRHTHPEFKFKTPANIATPSLIIHPPTADYQLFSRIPDKHAPAGKLCRGLLVFGEESEEEKRSEREREEEPRRMASKAPRAFIPAN